MTTIEFVGGPLCGHAAKAIGHVDIVAIKAPVASYAMYGTHEQGYRAVDPNRCEIDTVEGMESPKHVYLYQQVGINLNPVFMYVGLK